MDPVAAIMSGLARHTAFDGVLAIPVGRGVLRIKEQAVRKILDELYMKLSLNSQACPPGMRDAILWAFFEKASH